MGTLKTAPFPSGLVDVTSPDVASLTLVTPLPLYARVYIGPWLVAYPLAAYAFYGDYDRYIKSIGELETANAEDGELTRPSRIEWSFLLCIVLFGGHALSFLFTRWSVSFRSRGEARHVSAHARWATKPTGPELIPFALNAGYRH